MTTVQVARRLENLNCSYDSADSWRKNQYRQKIFQSALRQQSISLSLYAVNSIRKQNYQRLFLSKGRGPTQEEDQRS